VVVVVVVVVVAVVVVVTARLKGRHVSIALARRRHRIESRSKKICSAVNTASRFLQKRVGGASAFSSSPHSGDVVNERICKSMPPAAIDASKIDPLDQPS
jgi:Flp pilus assembly protein TadB